MSMGPKLGRKTKKQVWIPRMIEIGAINEDSAISPARLRALFGVTCNNAVSQSLMEGWSMERHLRGVFGHKPKRFYVTARGIEAFGGAASE